jgi:hypothetical protein
VTNEGICRRISASGFDAVGTENAAEADRSTNIGRSGGLMNGAMWRGITAAVLAASVLALQGCGNSGGSVVVQQSANQRAPLNPNSLQQFGSPFVEIPIAPVNPSTPTTYNVSVRQGTWDFGLRWVDGSRIIHSATGKPVVTKTWGYDVNGVFFGVYGPTVEATRGTPLTFNYTNDLRDEINGVKGTGACLTFSSRPSGRGTR